jgi:hypothetical protein
MQKQKEKWYLSKQSSSIVEQINQSRLIYIIKSSKNHKNTSITREKKLKKRKNSRKIPISGETSFKNMIYSTAKPVKIIETQKIKSHKSSKNSQNSASNQIPTKQENPRKRNRSKHKTNQKRQTLAQKTRTIKENVRFFSLFKGAGVAKVEEIIDPISINTNRTIRRLWC